jgi:hypothetical protein
MPNPYEEFDETFTNFQGYEAYLDTQKEMRSQQKRRASYNNVKPAPPVTEDIIVERQSLIESFDNVHTHFPNSTGVKPYGHKQIKSIQFNHRIMKNGGRALKLEPRGCAKTSRVTNEATMATLLGMQRYILIVANAMDKANEILASIKTELTTNDSLYRLFPATIACFRHLDKGARGAQFQTYDGLPTHITFNEMQVIFPIIDGEPSSGSVIDVRPRDNLKGLFYKIPAGENAGKIIRPTLIILDDIQTENDASQPKTIAKIISNVKRSALRGGSHSKRVSCIMNITPVAIGDVAWHFAKNEHSFELSRYKLLEKLPSDEAQKMWMNDYAKIYLNYDREIPGDRLRAALAGKQYVIDNYDKLHEDAEACWEWAYGWEEDPITEVSAVHHAYNILLDDGQAAFEFECQCNIEYGSVDVKSRIYSVTSEQILSKTIDIERYKVPVKCSKIVSHIDINQDVLTYVTATSPSYLQPHILDYGFHPPAPIFRKHEPIISLRQYYKTNDVGEAIQKGLKELYQLLSDTTYDREDGIELSHSLILSDCRYMEDDVFEVCRRSRNKLMPAQGIYIGPDDDRISLRKYPDGCTVYKECVEKPNSDNTLSILQIDTNFMKTTAHKLMAVPSEKRGSATLWYEVDPYYHLVFSQHWEPEKPKMEIGARTGRKRLIWKASISDVENEYFDNFCGCLAGFFKLGCDMYKAVTNSSMNISDYLLNQGKLL